MPHVEHVAVCVLEFKSKIIMTLPRRYRLARREGFSRILHQRAQIRSWFAVHSKTNTLGHTRLGMSVTKRVMPAATQRNFAKRLIRECFRKYARQDTARDIVIRLRKPIIKNDIAAARLTLGELMKTILKEK